MREEKSPHTCKALHSAGTRVPGGGKGPEPQGGRSNRSSGRETKGVTTETLLSSASQWRGGWCTRAVSGLVGRLRLPGLGPRERPGRAVVRTLPRGLARRLKEPRKSPAGQRSAATVPKKAGPRLREGPCGGLSLPRRMSQANASDRGRHNPTAMRHAREGNAGCWTTVRAGPALAGVRGRGH